MDDLMSAHIGAEGEVVALTKKACYVYKHRLDEAQAKKLLQRLSEKQKIDTQYWDVEWEFSSSSPNAEIK